eukprot:TRINITY_DN35902_c0_g1_i1.p1 TRINITY_DN35902_c0_g1~~TRINITY_DN35902_c0_g1_i1.p1  ORF type:complete len:405 (+),score=44.09 TRINITY_DN35902_c0_g1_i1:137-1216(+)
MQPREALEMDDQCDSFKSRGDDRACAIYALQRRVVTSTDIIVDGPQHGAAQFWSPAVPSESVWIQVLSYNLYWWNLWRKHSGYSASSLIKNAGSQHRFDVMGFQECEDSDRVLKQGGMQSTYTAFNDTASDNRNSICMAYRTAKWSLFARGVEDVAEDRQTQYFGKRPAQWMRLKHVKTGLGLFFVNHHGPLPIDSGGVAGGIGTANNIFRLIEKFAQNGDVIILVGDFNADSKSDTIKQLAARLHLVYTGPSFGGVDNVFSNVQSSQLRIRKDLGAGGSDHHAIEVVMKIVGGPPKNSLPATSSTATPATIASTTTTTTTTKSSNTTTVPRSRVEESSTTTHTASASMSTTPSTAAST